MARPAPIALFVFRRAEHLRVTLESLAACTGFDPARVVVFGDGPRDGSERAAVEAARAVARDCLGEAATYRFAETNKGLSRSIIDGVTELVEAHGRVVVLEDDFVLSPHFLTYMDEALTRYADDERIHQVSAYAFDVPTLRGRDTPLLLPITTTWGWGTWRDSWRLFDAQASGWETLRTDRALRRRFNLGGAYEYAGMLEEQMRGQIDSWGVRFYWSVFRVGGLVVYPPETLVRNAGMDGTGTHGRGSKGGRLAGVLGQGARPAVTSMPPLSVRQDDVTEVHEAIRRQSGGLRGRLRAGLRRIVMDVRARVGGGRP